MYKWHQIKTLKERGLSIKRITRDLKLSRNTVRKYLRSSEPPNFKKREYEKELTEYDSFIKEMLRKGFIGTRIYLELKKISRIFLLQDLRPCLGNKCNMIG